MTNMAKIEVLTVGGSWMGYGTCSKHPLKLHFSES